MEEIMPCMVNMTPNCTKSCTHVVTVGMKNKKRGLYNFKYNLNYNIIWYEDPFNRFTTCALVSLQGHFNDQKKVPCLPKESANQQGLRWVETWRPWRPEKWDIYWGLMLFTLW